MTLELRERGAYIWVTWITGLLAGDDHCRWSAWVRAHFKYMKLPDNNPDTLTRWTAIHDDLVMKRAAELQAEGWTVRLEDRNKFTVYGRSAVAGKIDIVAIKGKQILIVDAKGGKRKDKDLWQVRLYMALYPKVEKVLCQGKTLLGEIVYADGRVDVTFTKADAERVFAQIRATGEGAEPQTGPSARECKYCNISECPDRFIEEDARGDAEGKF